jgi:hygromycin-B 7''-O-kinase
MASTSFLPPIHSGPEYAHALRTLEPWLAAILEVCRLERIEATPRSLRLGLVGTYPTVVVADRCVVKLIGPWWSGPESVATEADAFDLLAANPALPVPRRLAQGDLAGDWHYFVMSYLPGVPFSAVFERVSSDARLEVARWLGRVVRDLNRLPLRPGRVLRPDWEPFARFLREQRAEAVERHRAWGSLPAHLVDQLEGWLPPAEELLERSRPPAFVHGDLHGDHVLGIHEGDGFRPTGIIDFSDVQIGDPYYELAALQAAAFNCDRSLLAAFRETAELPTSGSLSFARRALAYLLLHDFDELNDLSWLAELATLDELADRLFGHPDAAASNDC